MEYRRKSWQARICLEKSFEVWLQLHHKINKYYVEIFFQWEFQLIFVNEECKIKMYKQFFCRFNSIQFSIEHEKSDLVLDN